jgi:hypothetical protein
MTPTIPGWSAATMPTPKSIRWSHAYPVHWDQQQILVPTAGIILSRSLTLTSGAQGKTKFRPKSTETYNSKLGSCLSNHSGVHHEATIPSITFCPCIQMHKQEVLALKKHQVAEPSLYLQGSPIHALDTVTSQNRTATLLVVSLSCGKFTCILRCLLP